MGDKRAGRRFTIIRDGEVPPGALTWSKPTASRPQMAAWRHAMLAAKGKDPRVLRVAWVIFDHVNRVSG